MGQGSEPGSTRGGVAYAWPPEGGLRFQALGISDRVRMAMGDEAGSLLHVQSNLVEHYFRLQRAERGLSNRAQALGRGAQIGTIRQIERERQRLGLELHTGIGQLLAAIRLHVEIIAIQLRDAPEAIQMALERIAALATDALEQVRSISRRLHPPEWQRLTLEAAVGQLWEISGIPQKFEASLRIEPLLREPEQEIKVLVYRAAQEALSNLTRHAHASRIRMSLEARGERVVLTIEDNGVGFDVAGFFGAPASVASGIGLRSIREQAAAVGGNLEITSGPAGTKLELDAPFAPPES